MYEYERPYDHGFDEPDTQFFALTTDEKRIDIRKNRHWFYNEEIDESDYDITYSILVDYKEYLTFPKDVSKDAAIQFILAQFDLDKEGTKELESMYAEMEAERRMGA